MTKHSPTHDYLPAAGRDAYLPFYDLFTAALGAKKLHGNLIGAADLAAGQRVLEIGCGTGNVSLRVARRYPGLEVVGTDPDPLALARARRKAGDLPGLRFERAYGQELPYPDGSFDRVLSALMLHHLDEATKAATLAETARVLRPGGSLHIVDFTGESRGLHGFLAGQLRHAGTDQIPPFAREAGLDCTKVASSSHPVLGGVAYYRATKPA